jgi:hypothetical protein
MVMAMKSPRLAGESGARFGGVFFAMGRGTLSGNRAVANGA